MIMKQTKIVLLSLVSVLCLESAVAESETQEIDTQNADKIVNIREMNGNVINNGISDKTVQIILADYKQQHKADGETLKQYKQTINDLRNGTIKAPVSSIQAAFAALAKGDSSLAEALFEKAAEESDKQSAKAYRNLGTLRWWDSQKALAAYRRATELDPDNVDGWNELGTLLKRVGDLDDAIAAYSKELALGETHQEKGTIAAAYGNLGIIYKTRGDLDKAIEFYEKGLAIQIALGDKQGMAAKYGNLGSVYKTRGDLDKAVEFHQKALTLNEALDRKEGMAINYGNLGIIYKTRGELDKAIEFQQKALTIDENMGNKQGMAEDYANLGLVYQQKGNKAEAKRYWQQSIELYNTLGSPMAKTVQGWLDKL